MLSQLRLLEINVSAEPRIEVDLTGKRYPYYAKHPLPYLLLFSGAIVPVFSLCQGRQTVLPQETTNKMYGGKASVDAASVFKSRLLRTLLSLMRLLNGYVKQNQQAHELYSVTLLLMQQKLCYDHSPNRRTVVVDFVSEIGRLCTKNAKSHDAVSYLMIQKQPSPFELPSWSLKPLTAHSMYPRFVLRHSSYEDRLRLH